MAKIDIFDRTLKIIARDYAGLLLRLAFPNTPVRLLGVLENVELSLPVHPVDFVHRIEHGGQEHILHLEFQLEHQADFPRRMCSYYGALVEQFKLPVVAIALYLKPRRSPIPDEYAVELGGQVVNRFTYPVLKLWDYVDEIRSGQYRGLAPLLTMLVRDPDENLLREERKLILDETDLQKRGHLLTVAVTIASRYFDKAFLYRFFREEVEQMREMSFIEEWIQEGIEEGIQEGIQEGIEQGQEQGAQVQRETILQILLTRFDTHPQQVEPLARQLEVISDLSKLKDLADHALRDFSLANFGARLSQMTAGQRP